MNNIPTPPPKWLQRHIRNTLTYYPKTGYLIWTNPDPQAHRIKPGDHAGNIQGNGYLSITFTKHYQKIQVLVHHICWFLHYGEWPPKEIDHQDTIKTHNWIKNLRLANRSQANRNRGLAKNNSSGVTGVSWDYKCNKWRAIIQYRGKTTTRSFDDFNAAVRARYQLEKQYFGRWRYSGT